MKTSQAELHKHNVHENWKPKYRWRQINNDYMLLDFFLSRAYGQWQKKHIILFKSLTLLYYQKVEIEKNLLNS